MFSFGKIFLDFFDSWFLVWVNRFSFILSRGTPYDYRSIMHYSKTAFGYYGKVTMETVDPYFQDLIGTNGGFSAIDIQQINLVYKCPPYKGLLPVEATPDCHDTSSYCEMNAWAGSCKNAWGKRNCPLTCKQCTPGKKRTTLAPTSATTPSTATSTSAPTCKDNAGSGFCRQVVDRCGEKNVREWMKKQCSKTCKFCK